MKYTDVLAALNKCKGDGTWSEISALTEIHYDTLARIACQKMKKPSVQSIEKIAAAIEKIASAKKRRLAKAS